MKYDLIWLEKEALPWLPTWMEIARLEGLPYVVDYDDAWFHRYENHWLSPLLGMRFELTTETLVMYRPDGSRFETFAELAGSLRVPF